ncbi:MAG: UDP-3-O-(3-hydroxymyristoyl)glucosamine N-acyltransferase [Rhodospirillaceae bacterium]|jgi:UDP-3-O-[3-hydroxymyristoyl] glucosamine N-acyltransferase|nr:UDP-3-O-(3-hydroxymyristoyl)glucosamine N-acyltransferase [Rhodospirillaceae bacterium]MBT5809079.1 UDP-3-O-(3-hydroxymyristoyl)glucosamine N-acyltransferase [Rhodospirillaceae bacterium]
MPDTRFFKRAGPFSLGQLADLSGAVLSEQSDPSVEIQDVSPLASAKSGDICFLDNKKYAPQLQSCKGSACILEASAVAKAPPNLALVLTSAPYMTYAKIAAAFYPDTETTPFIAPTAVIDESSLIGEGCHIGHGVVIGPKASIGDGCVIEPNVVIGAAVTIGRKTRIGANASLGYCDIGARVHLYPGVRIGQRGFGFAMDASGHKKVPQLGRVIIGDDVEVGANTTIDRGAGPDTVIGDGVMIDNLVQIGHNVQIGTGCVIVAQTGIAGSSTLEHHVALGGQSGIGGHITIGAGAQIGAQSGVMRDVASGQRMLGSPATTVRQFFRRLAFIERLTKTKGA